MVTEGLGSGHGGSRRVTEGHGGSRDEKRKLNVILGIEYKRFCKERRKRREEGKTRKWETTPLYIQEVAPSH
jgi:hypothetical protein